jgi:hypothetical protein
VASRRACRGLLANRTLALLDWHDLRLTAEEARGIGSAFSSDEATLETLHRQSDGWAAGLTLMLERVRRNGIAPGRLEAETREAVFNYFAGEILDRASSEDRHILVSTAFLPSSDCRDRRNSERQPARESALASAVSPSALHQPLRRHAAQLSVSRFVPTVPAGACRGGVYARGVEADRRRAAALLEEQGDLEHAVVLHARSEAGDEATV